MDEAKDTLFVKEEELDFSDDEQSTEDTINPFIVVGIWIEKTLNEVTAILPSHESFVEITSEFSNKTNSSSRFWMAPIIFTRHNYRCDTIRIEEVPIPNCQEIGYGIKFIHVCLPDSLRNLLKDSKNTSYPLQMNERNLIGAGGWWKSVHLTKNSLGCIQMEDMSFSPISINKIMKMTGKGLKATLNVRFVCKASTDSTKELNECTQRTVGVEVLRGYITSIDTDVIPPIRRAPPPPKPLAKDITTDQIVMKILNLNLRAAKT
ncbi:hypothetical protein GcM1_197017 [Golovinomyces cichoracearum]|uniref:Uncharacterized protein n=1 Tax=Golovinomyces cichoracearum TaxID=62708 RepID=A0A420IZL9_9PEZI|nr:hypothetical protein GcM1_197017 [Golovinomyces cichoracearum]